MLYVLNKEGERRMVKRKLNITVSENVYKKLSKLAEEAGLSKSAFLSILVNECYDKQK